MFNETNDSFLTSCSKQTQPSGLCRTRRLFATVVNSLRQVKSVSSKAWFNDELLLRDVLKLYVAKRPLVNYYETLQYYWS